MGGLERINAPKAWDIVHANESIHVGIVDGQFYMHHEDLAKAFVETLPSTDDQFSVRQFDDKGKLITDDHGTHVAGIIAAESNDRGVAGVAHGSSLYGYSWCGKDSHGKNKITARYGLEVGWTYLVDECGCSIINMSCGIEEATISADKTGTDAAIEQWSLEAYSYALQISLRALIQVGGHDDLIICKSAGNSNTDGRADWDVLGLIDDEVVKPHIVIVGSVQTDDKGMLSVSPFSSCGERVDVLAPGSNIYSTVYEVTGEGRAGVPYSAYGYKSGTSMAAPMIAGVAALVKVAYPEVTGDTIKRIICETSVGSYEDATGVSRGVVDAYSAVRMAKALSGDGSLIAADFVQYWYSDWTFGAGHDIDNGNPRPGRMLKYLNGESELYSSFIESGVNGQAKYSRASRTCVVDNPSVERNSDGTYRVTVSYVTSPDAVNQEEFDRISKNTHHDVWDVGVDRQGKVITLELVSTEESDREASATATDPDSTTDHTYTIRYDLNSLIKEGGDGYLGDIYVPNTITEYRNYYGPEEDITQISAAYYTHKASIPNSDINILYMFGVPEESEGEAYAIEAPLSQHVDGLEPNGTYTLEELADHLVSATGSHDIMEIAPPWLADKMVPDLHGLCYVFLDLEIYFADGASSMRSLRVESAPDGTFTPDSLARLDTYAAIYQ